MTTPGDTDQAVREAALSGVLKKWATAIGLHRPHDVAAVFAEDAVFQGSAPTYSVGRSGVASYYGARPVGLRVEYRIRETRALGDDAFTAFVDVDFIHDDGSVDPTHLTLVLVNRAEWLIQQYHVSKVTTAMPA